MKLNFSAMAEEVKLISDAETEIFLQELINPFRQLAQLKEAKIYLVQDEAINAFVDKNHNIFINTGLLMKFNKIEVLLGVLAHEIGHVVGKHALKTEIYQQDKNKAFFGYGMALGAILAKSPDSATAIALATNEGIYKMQLKYSRQQEDSADLIAIEFLEALNYPVSGLKEIFQFFLQQSLQENLDRQQKIELEYSQTHPLSEKRLTRIQQYQQKNAINWQKIAQFNERLLLIQAKLDGFLLPTDLVLKKYLDDNKTNHQIARAVAYFRLNQYQKSFQILDKAIKNNQSNGFLFELKAELLQKSRHIDLAMQNYQKAILLLDIKQSAMARLMLAEIVINQENIQPKLLDFVEQKLMEAKFYLDDKPLFFKQIATIFHLKKQYSYANFYLGKYYFLLQNEKKAKELWQEALKTEPPLDTQTKFIITDYGVL